MKKFLKGTAIVLGGLIGLLAVVVATIYIWVGVDLSRVVDVDTAGKVIDVPSDQKSIAEGQRLARLRGCFDGCHGENSATGRVFFELPDGTTVIAPDLAEAARHYSIEQFERLTRHGIRPDGTGVIGAMPVEMLYHLSDQDLGKIIAFLRSQPTRTEPLPETYFGPVARVFLLTLKQEFGSILAAETFDHKLPRTNAESTDPWERGQYLALSTCSECHGSDLSGPDDGSAPGLAVVSAYTQPAFTRLMRTGVAQGERELRLMSRVALSRFSHFTDAELTDLRTYLTAMGDRPLVRAELN